MAWETRGNGQKYFYLSEKLPGGRVRKHYLGNGFRAEIEAMRLEKVHADRANLKHEIASFQEAEATAEAHFRMVDELVSAIFVIAGYHNTRYRGWRRIKMIESEALEVQVDQPVKLDQPVEVDMERFSELVKAAKSGDRTVVPELRRILEAHPALRELDAESNDMVVIDVTSVLENSDGSPLRYAQGKSGSRTRLREKDGTHLTQVGAQIYATAVLKELGL